MFFALIVGNTLNLVVKLQDSYESSPEKYASAVYFPGFNFKLTLAMPSSSVVTV